jgi:3-hydroxyacyl-[acyl-carrier-protein] dehydratase
MRYFLIDRIERLEINTQITAVKNVTLSEDVFSDHFIGSPVMPGALLIETLAQAGTALLEISVDLKKKALLVMVMRAKFRAIVRPGDQLRVTVTLRSRDNDLAETDCAIHVGDRLVADARLVFSLQDVEQFYSDKVRQIIEAGYDMLLRDAQVIDPAVKQNE